MSSAPSSQSLSSSRHCCSVSMKHDKMTTVNSGLAFHLSLLTLLIVPLMFFSSSASAACNHSDRETLLLFLNSASVSPPLNWSTSIDCCSWEGVTCESNDDRVINLSLPSKGLNGYIPPSLTNLTYLSYLNLSHNFLLNPPSFKFFSMNRLRVLDFSFNLLSGQLPSGENFNGSTVIEILDLSSNLLSGLITSSFIEHVGKSGTLTNFNVSNNNFEGQLPTSFCLNSSSNCSLSLLDLSSNDFYGQIGTGLGKCPNLKIFKAGFNDLSGPMPNDIFDAQSLEVFSLPHNHISGNISDDIVRLSKLINLELYSNTLSGTLPPSLMNCTNLIVLNLRVNLLSGDLSTLDFSNLLWLTTLDLGNNAFTGTLPSTLYLCRSLKALRLSSNQIVGEILPEIALLQSLTFLSISNNKLDNITRALHNLNRCKNLSTLVLSGSYLGEVFPDDDNIMDPNGFQNIQVLALSGGGHKGQVPSWIANLKKLEVLDLSFNKLTGSIPGWLSNLPSLFYIDLTRNQISGEFPTELCRLPALMSKLILDPSNQSYLALPIFVAPSNASNQQYNPLRSFPPALYLGSNNISGNIPIEIGQLKVLQVLDLSQNNFSGEIPDTISNLANLEILDMSSNHLIGEIPNSLRGLQFLSAFSVANNDLQGPIPTGGQFDTFTSSSFEGNPRLCGIQVLGHSCSDPNLTGITSSTDITSDDISSTKLIFGIAFGISYSVFFITVLITCWIRRRLGPFRGVRRVPNSASSFGLQFEMSL